jgi:alpha-N-acetylglucosaminidase
MAPLSRRKLKAACRLAILIAILPHPVKGIDRTAQPSAAGLAPVVELAHRVVPWMDGKLEVIRIQKQHGEDRFELATEIASGTNRAASFPGQTRSARESARPTQIKLVIRATDAVSAAMGLNYYLKYYCHRSLSHVGSNLRPIKALPLLTQPVRRTSRFKYRYFLNYCTFNYSFAFAGWAAWERELDWMALNGINLALATNGTEAVWQNTLRRMGYSQAEILQFIPGPAYTAWWLMGNLEGWGGPISERMIDDRVALESKILARMRQLGIEPLMQGFYGMVPASLGEKFPQAQIVEQGRWGGFRRPKILLSSDPLFARMASIYYEEMSRLYGPVRFYGGDLFHEGGSAEGLDLAKLGRGVQEAMLQANPQAVWVLQGWQGNPRPALLDGLSPEHVLILNMESNDWEKRKGFGGLLWVWGVINDFGENTGMFGNLPWIAAEPARAKNGPYGASMAGVGALMEGTNNNPVAYELLLDEAWRKQPANLGEWIREYVRARYGEDTPELERAWSLLLETVYTNTGHHAQSVFCARPSLEVKGTTTWGSTALPYDPEKLEEGAREFLKAKDRMRRNDAYQYDAVNLVRQVLANRGMRAYREMVGAYQRQDKAAFRKASQEFLRLLRAEDALLATRREFMLGTWLAEAKAMGHTQDEMALCERNARTQITYWGPDDPATDLHEYAHKEWSGLLEDFYLPRWEMFVENLGAHLEGKAPRSINYFEFEKKWTEQRNKYPVEPSGDPVTAAAQALAKTCGRP